MNYIYHSLRNFIFILCLAVLAQNTFAEGFTIINNFDAHDNDWDPTKKNTQEIQQDMSNPDNATVDGQNEDKAEIDSITTPAITTDVEQLQEVQQQEIPQYQHEDTDAITANERASGNEQIETNKIVETNTVVENITEEESNTNPSPTIEEQVVEDTIDSSTQIEADSFEVEVEGLPWNETQ